MNLTRLLCQFVGLAMALTLFTGVTLVNYAYPAGGPAQTPGLKGDLENAEYRRALDLIGQGKIAEALPLLQTARRYQPDNAHLLADYLDALVWLHLYDKAINLYVANKNKIKHIKYLYRNMAQAFYETGDYYQAQLLYSQAFSVNLSDVEALKGLVFASCKLKDYQKAFDAWLTAYQQKTIPFANLAALRIYLLQIMGVPSLALQYARAAGVTDQKLLNSLKGDEAVERIKWEEYDVAIQILQQLLQQNPDNFRARSDYIVALRDKYRMKEVLEQYQILEKSGRPAPYWANEAVADAWLYLKRPEEAEKFYKLSLKHNPTVPINTYLGLLNTYTELRQWDKAEAARSRIEYLLKHRQLNYVEKNDALVTLGWLHIYQDQLQKAQDYFDAALREAGLNPGFRSGLGDTYYFRGWPRKALEQYQIALTVSPQDRTTLVSKAYALNNLNYKYGARELAAELYRKYPFDRHVQNLQETLRAEDMNLLWSDARFVNEWPGVTEYRFRGGVAVPVTPLFQLTSSILHMHSLEYTNSQKYAYSWDRLSFGFSCIVLPSLTLTQSASWDYLKSGDLGSYTALGWQANDHLKATASFDSFSLDIPLRARATGVKGKTAQLNLYYCESELRDYNVLLMSNWLTDGNYNPAILLWFEQNVINTPDWKLRVGPEFYYDRYSKNFHDVPYFSPNFEYSLVLRPTLQITHYDRYDTRIRSNIYTNVGLYKEWGYGFYPIAGIRYEQEIKISKTFGLRWTLGYNTRVYDGRYTNVLEGFFTISKRF
jgi:biofilm PGA synthesis protein PgaA